MSQLAFRRLDAGNANENGDGGAFLIGTSNEGILSDIKQAANVASTSPDPASEGSSTSRSNRAGPMQRYTDRFSTLGLAFLQHIGLNGHETANDIQTRVFELFRNEFPILKPRFEATCTECGAEYQEDVEVCRVCDGETRPPNLEQKREAEQMLESVNKEGQSLRGVAREAEWDQWLAGVPVLVLRHKYAVSNGPLAEGEVIASEPMELLKADPKRVVPVVDENRRIGGHWWACPIDRTAGEDGSAHFHDRPGDCEECGAPLREVYFAELGDGYDEENVESVYFEEEVLTYPYPFPRHRGLDGLSPIHHIWVKQAIIEMQDSYAAAFYDPESERLPNQFMILHTTNADKWEERLEKARKESKEDVYESPVFANEYSPQSGSTPEVQVVDAMPDELLGQNESLRDQFKSDIRQALNVSDLHDSDLEEGGGLNNEGLQLEVVDRSIAEQQHEYVTGWLDELGKRLGIEDYYIAFRPSSGTSADELRAEIEAGVAAANAGLDASIENEQVEIADGPFDPVDPQPDVDGDGDGDGDGDVHRDAELEAATRLLFDAQRHLTWPDLVDQKARQPFFASDEDMPEFVRDLIERVLDSGRAIQTVAKDLPSWAGPDDVRGFFREKLDQPQGWSLRSLTEDYADRFGVSEDEAVTDVRTHVSEVMAEARVEGYEQQGDTDERRFKVVGPVDDRKTAASWELLERTNPDHADRNEYTLPGEGGQPRPLDEIKELFALVRTKHFPEFDGSGLVAHWNERDTVTEHFE